MPNHSLFSVVGIEIEYMLVHQNSLNVAPSSDVLLGKFSQDTLQNEVMLDQIAMSNELVMHVIELKNNGLNHPLLMIFSKPFNGFNHI